MKTDALIEPYFAEARGWDADKRSGQRRVARLAFWVAGAGWAAM